MRRAAARMAPGDTVRLSASVLDDREVLTAPYNATGGPDWMESEGWLTDATLGQWYGIDTTA